MSKYNAQKTFQRILLQGRLAKDPELKFIGNGNAVCNFGLVINEIDKESNYIPCVAWGDKAKAIKENATKGTLLQCEGKIKSSTYKDSEGRKQFSLQLELSGILNFIDQKNDLEGLGELPPVGDDL